MNLKSSSKSCISYYPFGLTFNKYKRTASVAQRFKYNSFELDENTGLYDYQARYYDPAIARFINVDPAAELMRRWSTYAYAFNNPIRFIDPDGMMPEDEVDKDQTEVQQEVASDIEAGTPSQEPSLWESVLESLPEISLEMSVSVGAQAGVTVGKLIDADLSILSVEVLNDKTTLKDGKLDNTKKLGTKEVSLADDNPRDSGMKVTNEVGFTIAGFGGSIGQEQNLHSDLRSSDYKSFVKTTSSTSNFGSTVSQETDLEGNTTNKQESGFSLGLKFIVGVELKVQITQ